MKQKIKVRIAKNSGFCFGVKKAINLALKASKEEKKIVTLGPIIHNPQMVNKLNEQGIESIEKLSEINDRPTIIRSHGVEKNILQKLKHNNIKILDATCPYVSKTQNFANKLSREGYFVIIMGDKNHPEVQALCSYVSGEVLVVENADELIEKKYEKIGIISQTTRNVKDLQKLVGKLVPLCKEMRIINTICNATTVRQNSTIELAKKSDLMIVIGGKNSSNTKMLAKISTPFVKTFHIETENEIQNKWFENIETVGITAGASTPDLVIVNVYNKIIKDLKSLDNIAKKIEDIPGF